MTTRAEIFAALGDDTRLAIVAKLCAHGPQSIVDLTAGTRVTRQAITKHLDVLAAAGLVRSERDGRSKIYEFRAKPLADARKYLDQISDQWDAALERLRALVEE